MGGSFGKDEEAIQPFGFVTSEECLLIIVKDTSLQSVLVLGLAGAGL
jgi:hypothetical protein